jgi:4-hydroxybenzoate polyprenyltransferase
MSTLRTYAQLCRLPAVFTAMADIFLGYLLTHLDLTPIRSFAGLLVASSGLYLAGMVLNDIFDREVDARERPNRPIPSGRVPLKNAILFATMFIAIGIGAAAFVGKNSLVVALILLANIFLYDGFLKKTPLGPIAMGGCRFLNIILGASSAGNRVVEAFLLPQLLVAIGMGVYVAGITWFARKEAEQSGKAGLIFGLIVLNLGLLIQATWISPWGVTLLGQLGWPNFPGDADPWRALVILGAFAFIINRRAIAAILDPSPRMVQNTVRVMLMSIITIDAVLIYNKLGDSGVPYAGAVVALLVPSFLLGRWMSMT